MKTPTQFSSLKGAKSPSWELVLMLSGLTMIGPFSIDTYLPSFHEISKAYQVPMNAVQQSLTAYLVAFALMTLWHGSFADSFGRRRIILINLSCYAVASIGCVFAQTIEQLIFFRVLQGLCAGAGVVVARAIVRDCFEGLEAQRMMSLMAVIFPIAPAIAPIFGGWLQVVFGFRSIFVFLTLFSFFLIALIAWRLPETLPHSARQPFRPQVLWVGYRHILTHREFLKASLSLSIAFCGFFIYIVSAPVFLIEHLHLREDQFYWLFVPFTAGLLMGALIANRRLGRWDHRRQLTIASALMIASAAINVLYNLMSTPRVPWAVVFLPLYTIGIALASPILMLKVLDNHPTRRGMASSCQSFIHLMIGAIVAGLIAPLLWRKPSFLALWNLAAAVVAALIAQRVAGIGKTPTIIEPAMKP